ncbi:MAG: EAL domain-containing protein, partial [Bryobacteraceae bacterium]
PSELPIIMVTALTDSASMVEALNQGANDYITKPVDFPVALARVHSQLRRKWAETALRESEERFALAAQGTNDGLWDWDIRGNMMYYSPRWCEMLGIEPGTLEPTLVEWLSRVHPDDAGSLRQELELARQGSVTEFINEHRVMHADGSYRWMLARASVRRGNDGTAIRMAGSQTDVTKNKAYDALTSLPNRVLLVEQLSEKLARFRAGKEAPFAVFFLDIDRFKVINDSLGHRAGDRLLVEVGQRLRRSIRQNTNGRPEDIVARLGGDEFALLVSNVNGPSVTQVIAARIIKELQAPLVLEGRDVYPNASIGIALARPDCIDPMELLHDADTAMYRAKNSGKAKYAVFDAEMRAQALERLQVEAGLRKAIDRSEFHLYYQPKMDLGTGRVVGFEALLRWHHPERGIILPSSFVPIAEETGLIVPIGEWVLREACRATRRWQDTYKIEPPLEISVNVSVRQFRQKGFLDLIQNVLSETGLDPATLQLEITESVLIDDMDSAMSTFQAIKSLGVGLKIDDFGTGYSSLNYLAHLPFDSLKIDRSFVSTMCQDPQALELVRTILDLARNLGMQVVAEGVETPDQAERLQQLGCPFGQGYYFSQPLPFHDADQLLGTGKPPAGVS